MSSVDRIHALLFVADSPSTVAQLARAANLTEGQVDQALEVLSKNLEKQGPIQLIRIAGGYQLATKPEYAELISGFLMPQRQRLSKSQMEVLAVIAYRQPITTAEIESVRGVQSDYSLRGLLDRRLIREVGRKSVPGRPILYGTTPQFLHQFGIADLSALPAIDVSTMTEGLAQLEAPHPELPGLLTLGSVPTISSALVESD